MTIILGNKSFKLSLSLYFKKKHTYNFSRNGKSLKDENSENMYLFEMKEELGAFS